MKAHRPARIAEAIREVASETILFKLNDPRVKNVTVTRCEVSADLQRAKVYVSVMGTEQDQQMCMHGLANAAGFIQKQLGDRLQMRFTPILQFVTDQGVKNSIAISKLLKDEEAKLAPASDVAEATSTTDAAGGTIDAADGPHQDSFRP